MMKIRLYFRAILEEIFDHSIKNDFFGYCFGRYYHAAICSLRFVLKQQRSQEILTVYLRHEEWILGASDIDLVFIIRSSDHDKDIVFFKKLWKTYFVLRLFYPILCKFEEIRFISQELLQKHPLKENAESYLLLAPHKWRRIYSNNDDDSARKEFLSKGPIKASLPLTRFLHFNFYSYIQWVILSDQRISKLKFLRLRKNMMKIRQHLSYVKEEKTNEGLLLSNELISTGIPAKEILRQDVIISEFRELILDLHRTHAERYDLSNELYTVPHANDDSWMTSAVKVFIRQGNELFGDRFQLVMIRPICDFTVKSFLFIDESFGKDLFNDLIDLSRQHNLELFKSSLRLYFVTDKILTSQYYTLWSPFALEAHILLARGAYNPKGSFKIKLPSNEWTLWKIRNSISIFEEYYLPFLTSPNARGKGINYCKLYERPEVEILFQYFYYLKDRDSYFDDLKKAKGDLNEMLCLIASKYANEIGIQDWFPRTYDSAYPYIKRMVRLIDQMAYDQIYMKALV